MNDLQTTPQRPLVTREVKEEAKRLYDQAIAQGTPPNTARAYKSDFAYFAAWHEAHFGELPGELPWAVEGMLVFVGHHALQEMPEDVVERLVEQGRLRRDEEGRVKMGTVSTLERRLASLSTLHQLAGVPDHLNPRRDPRVREMLKRARKSAAAAGQRVRKPKAATRPVLDRLVGACNDLELAGVRDQALLLFAWATGGRRRSEVCAALVQDLTETRDPENPEQIAYWYHLPRHKGDPQGEGADLPVTGRAAEALEYWLRVSEISEGPIFRRIDRWGNLGDSLSPEAVRLIVKRRAQQAGLDPAAFSPHSLRSGFATESGLQGVPEAEARAMTRHKSVAVFAGYQQPGNLLRSKASRMAG
ncbi:MAG: site-specific integrase [Deltaproteobacteria bacterium]|nr:site-specific integrase [Deltaproteobacteria bacterium]